MYKAQAMSLHFKITTIQPLTLHLVQQTIKYQPISKLMLTSYLVMSQ